ncbi:MAG: cysteine desulfurase [Candidatus Aenigmarchaeota archaeon]|nr:cysteine desulfurase [Candidatus Aenigmarchaeota archaeon]
MPVDFKKFRKDFPVLKRKVNGKTLVYLDSAATSLKPVSVLDAMNGYYMSYTANVARGVHKLAEEATEEYESGREKVASFIGTKPAEVIFTRNTTEALNLLVYSLGFGKLKRGDEVLSTVMEHHSNIVPWQFLKAKGIKLKFVDVNPDGTLKMEQYEKLLTKKTKLVTVTHVSNVLGTINPVSAISKLAHDNDSLLIVDGAQSVPHMPVDVKKLDIDFLAFSGHKMLGPTGIGVLYGKEGLLAKLQPFLGGGDMIKEVGLQKTVYNSLPWKFEAGTPNIAGAIGLGAAVDYLQKVGMKKIRDHDKELTDYTLEKLSDIRGMKIFGPKNYKMRSGVVSFELRGVHPHDIASILNSEGIAIRSGHACAQPLMDRLGVTAVARASFYLYNTRSDIDKLVLGLEKARKVFKLA